MSELFGTFITINRYISYFSIIICYFSKQEFASEIALNLGLDFFGHILPIFGKNKFFLQHQVFSLLCAPRSFAAKNHYHL